MSQTLWTKSTIFWMKANWKKNQHSNLWKRQLESIFIPTQLYKSTELSIYMLLLCKLYFLFSIKSTNILFLASTSMSAFLCLQSISIRNNVISVACSIFAKYFWRIKLWRTILYLALRGIRSLVSTSSKNRPIGIISGTFKRRLSWALSLEPK